MLLLKEDFFCFAYAKEILMFVLNPLEMQASSPYYYCMFKYYINIAYTHIVLYTYLKR